MRIHTVAVNLAVIRLWRDEICVQLELAEEVLNSSICFLLFECRWFRRGWRVVRCVYCTYNALHQQDLRVELSCQGTAPRTVQVRLLEASGREKEGPDIPPSSWGGVALCALMRSEVPPGVPGLRVMRGPLAVPWAGGSCEGSRAFLELFEKHAAEGDLLGLLPSTGRGTNALCEILAGHLLQSAALLPCVETLASLQGGSPLMALHISRAYARRGQLEAALSALLRCLHAYPEEACLLRQLAELLLRGGLHELAARAASYAVELCPTVPRYWLTLARAEIACGCWGNALLALNAAPDVSVSFPFYPHGLPSDLDTYPVTQPRQQGMGYYSALWLAPVKPELLPFRHRGSTHSGGEIFSGATAAPTAGALLRTPKGLLDSGRKSSTSQGTEHFTSSLTSSYRSHPSGTPRDLEAAGGSPSPTRLEASGSAPAVTAASFVPPQRRSEGGPFYHRGFGASFGLAKGLDEETVIRAHAEMVQKERKPQGRASHTDLEALWRRCSSGSTAEHLRVMIGSRAQALDLSERRRYSVLASLHKRIGLRGLNALRGALFLPSADNATGIAPNTLMEGSSGSGWLAASGAEGPTTAAISSLPVTQEGGGLGASSPDCCSFEAGMETVIGEAAETEMYDAEALNCMHADSLASPASSCRDPPSPTRLSLPAESVCDEASGEAVPEAVRSPVASVLRDETKDLRDSVTGNDFKASSVVGGPLQAAQGGINNDATGKLGEVPATVDARDGPTRRDSEGCHIGQQKQHPVVEATLRTLAGDEDSIHDVLLRPSLAASLSLETPVASVGGVRAAVRQLSPSLAGLLAVQYKQHSCSISRIRVVPPGRSLDVAVLTSYVAPGTRVYRL